jgi:hypothetical protein
VCSYQVFGFHIICKALCNTKLNKSTLYFKVFWKKLLNYLYINLSYWFLGNYKDKLLHLWGLSDPGMQCYVRVQETSGINKTTLCFKRIEVFYYYMLRSKMNTASILLYMFGLEIEIQEIRLLLIFLCEQVISDIFHCDRLPEIIFPGSGVFYCDQIS